MAMKQITKGYPNWDVPYNENVEEYNNTIGNVNMGTTATTITGAIKEIKELAETETSKIQTVVADVNNNKTKIAEHTSQLNAKVNKSSVINNCSVTEDGFALDARQGKILNDKLNTKINLKTYKLNQIVQPGEDILIDMSGFGIGVLYCSSTSGGRELSVTYAINVLNRYAYSVKELNRLEFGENISQFTTEINGYTIKVTNNTSLAISVTWNAMDLYNIAFQ